MKILANDQTPRVETKLVMLARQVMRALIGSERQERRIRLTAISVLLAVVLGSGGIILVQVANNNQTQLEQALRESLRNRVRIVDQALEYASESGASNAADRPHLKTVLGRILDGNTIATDAADLQRILDSLVKRANTRAVLLRDGQGNVLGQRGKMLTKPLLSAPIHLPYPAKLLWDQSFVLELQIPIIAEGRRLGEATEQMALMEIDDLFANQESLGMTGEFVLCAKRSVQDMTCFPSRWSAADKAQESRYRYGQALPMHYALEGKTGIVQALDYRKQSVIAAYGAVDKTGLGMVIKRDHSELAALTQRDFIGAIPFLLLLSVGGVSLLIWRLTPLVRNVVESRAKLKAVIDSAPDAIVSLDEEGRILSFNPAAVVLFGYQSSEVSGSPIARLSPESDTVITRMENGLGQGKRKDGTIFPIEISVAKTAGEIDAGHVVTLRDITLRRQAEDALMRHFAEVQALNAQVKDAQAQLLQSEKMASVGQLAAGVAHEINNPIGYIYSNLGTLEHYRQEMFRLLAAYEEAESAISDSAVLARLQAAKAVADIAFLRDDARALMDETREGITRVKKIVQDLKDFSRIDAVDEWHWADLQKGLDSTLNIVWSELKYKAEVRKEYADIPEVECRPSQLNQVFMNLLVNAGHAIEEKGIITLRTGQIGEEVWVEIADSGKGIDPAHVKRIFDPFFTTKPIGQGTGLGLSLSYGIVQKHGGRIEVQSELGNGAAFRVCLPIRQSEVSKVAMQDALRKT